MPDTPYLKRYHKGPYEIRILRDVGKFSAQIYEENSRTDVLTSVTLPGLNAKIDRYLAGEASASELKRLAGELTSAKEEIAALTKSLTEVGDGNAKAAQYEKELEDVDLKLTALRKELAQAESDRDQYKEELAAAKSVKKTPAKPDTPSKTK